MVDLKNFKLLILVQVIKVRFIACNELHLTILLNLEYNWHKYCTKFRRVETLQFE